MVEEAIQNNVSQLVLRNYEHTNTEEVSSGKENEETAVAGQSDVKEEKEVQESPSLIRDTAKQLVFSAISSALIQHEKEMKVNFIYIITCNCV